MLGNIFNVIYYNHTIIRNLFKRLFVEIVVLLALDSLKTVFFYIFMHPHKCCLVKILTHLKRNSF